ncbi:MAG: hypothetical protein LBQ42_13840 [Synergistaceae bacterium]|jgi:tetratricopeptide (TPR) repeat protein|nr:hypothetical protein [Synergistaceae bacterium]
MGFRRLFFILWASLAAFTLLQGTAEANNVDVLEEFLKRTPLSAAERTDILKAVQAIRSSPSETEPAQTGWVLSGGGDVYGLALVPVQKDERANVQAKLEEMGRAKANLRARYLLYLRAWSQSSRKTRYADEDSVAEALDGWDKGRDESVRLKPNLSVGAVSKDWAFALLRVREEPLNALRTQIEGMPENALDTNYCAALYPKAREFFDQERYQQALPVYRELHSLRWARPVAYLDAAECFLRTGDLKSAARLARETTTELEGLMDSALLARAGDIAFEAGEETWAERLYRRAVEKLRQEP